VELARGTQGHGSAVRRASTVQGKKRAPGQNLIWALLLDTEAYLSGCEGQPNFFPLAPSLCANKNKYLPYGVQNKDTILERRVGCGGDVRELGCISLVPVTR